METTTTKKNTVKKTPIVEVVLNNFDVEKLAERLARMMPAIINNIVRREYSKNFNN